MLIIRDDYRKLIFVACVLFIEAGQLALGQTACVDNGNYTRNSMYAVNLNSTFTILSRNLRESGFYNASVGEGEDRANAVVLCRGDAQLEACLKCIQDSADVLLRSCPFRKQAIRWDDRCMLRYSNATIYGALALGPGRYLVNSNNITGTRVEQFETDLRRLLYGLHGQATSGGSPRKVAAQSFTLPDSSAIYALVQCSPELSQPDCSNCLNNGFEMRQRLCGGKRGCRLLFPSCILRYEIYNFYNETRLQELDRLSLSPSPSLPPGKGDGNTSKPLIIILVPTVLGLVLAVSVIIWLRRNRKTQNPTENYQRTDDEIITAESLQYPFTTIKTATNDFSDDNKLGEGGFGSVYEGELPNGQEIAVKRLSMNSGQGVVEFKNEVLLLAKLQHRNLVRLFGFAIQGTEKLLIYELVQNASLDQFIFDERRRSYLDWDKRYKIIGGIARGILYLHEDSRLRIIHRDLKTSNILLDREMNPKIADFGMARLFGQDETQGNTSRVVGTYGYMPPEYLIHGQFSTKSDVFSFGVLVLEIISGRRNNNFRSGDSVEDLLSFAWKNWRGGRAANVVDPSLRSGPNSGSMSEMTRCIHISLLCVQENAAERPTMAAVVIMLSSSSINLALPCAPAFYLPATSYVDDYNSRSVSADQSESYNEVSITDFHPR